MERCAVFLSAQQPTLDSHEREPARIVDDNPCAVLTQLNKQHSTPLPPLLKENRDLPMYLWEFITLTDARVHALRATYNNFKFRDTIDTKRRCSLIERRLLVGILAHTGML